MAVEAQILANQRDAQMMVLSFLRRQESRVLDVPGFRIKCGMTARRSTGGEIESEFRYDLKKQSQFYRSVFGVQSSASRSRNAI